MISAPMMSSIVSDTTLRIGKHPHAFFWFTWDIAWFHPVTHQLLSRGHHNHYRVTSIHYNNDSAKKPDSVYALLYDLMILAIRDRHDYVACDMNQATAKFKDVLTNIAPRYPEINFQLICNFSEEVCLLYIQYDFSWKRT